eukprot:maker-scaffold619_size123246-snap-gene-0.31 protein:Tk05498 transcript:maker-scaffold619_size123246-snap-gene-0.31-mRNA-1 annotation:"hypothetical protein DAPPUDRAFT_304089"
MMERVPGSVNVEVDTIAASSVRLEIMSVSTKSGGGSSTTTLLAATTGGVDLKPLGRKRAQSESSSSALAHQIPGKIRKLDLVGRSCHCRKKKVKCSEKVSQGEESPQESAKGEMNTPVDSGEDPDKEKEKKEILSMMECPVCLEHPREGPIYNCQHGHLVCGKCQPKIRECPVCRSANIGHRNLFAEKMLQLTLKSITLPCTNHNEGCKIIKVEAGDKPYVSVIGDFVENETVFKRASTTHWKPVMLVSRKNFRLFAYLVMSRTPTGEWYFFVRSFTGDEIVKLIRTKITVRSPSSADKKSEGPEANTTEFSYSGAVNSYGDSEEAVINTGHYLYMKDAQVKQFKHEKTLLEYEVQLSVNAKVKNCQKQ